MYILATKTIVEISQETKYNMLTMKWLCSIMSIAVMSSNLNVLAAGRTSRTQTKRARAEAEGHQQLIDNDFRQLLGKCEHNSDSDSVDRQFDICMKGIFNELRAYFPTGIPAYHIKPFDPHHADFIELRRGDKNTVAGFSLILRNVSEYGWTNSEVTKYRTDFNNTRIIYSQYFPEKSLEGKYEFAGKLLGTPIKRKGFWNMTLYDYSQTTSVRRLGDVGSLLKVHVEVDHIGGLKMHISDFLVDGRDRLNEVADNVINSMWPIGLPFIKPIINELVRRKTGHDGVIWPLDLDAANSIPYRKIAKITANEVDLFCGTV